MLGASWGRGAWMRWVWIAVWMLAWASWLAPARAEQPMLTRLTPDLRVFPQFFSVAQGVDGQLYVGGTDGILRNDGGRWIWMANPKQGPVRVLEVDAGGRVWYGGSDSFGYLKTLPTGEMRFVDLSPQFARDLAGKPFSDIWKVARFHDQIWFQALHDVFAVDAQGRRIGHWHHDARFGFIGSVQGQLWLQWRDEGIRRWDGKRFVPVPGTSSYTGAPIYNMFSLPDGTVLIQVEGSGLSLWRDGVATPLVDPKWQDDIPHLSNSIDLGDGQLAFAGDDGKLRVLDLAQRQFHTVTIGSGFITDLAKDRQGNLLAADNMGVVRLAWPPRWSRYALADGVSGDIHDFTLIGDRLFVCGSAGAKEARIQAGMPALPLQPLAWTSGECWTVRQLGDSLLVADSMTLRRANGQDSLPVSAGDLYPRTLRTDPLDPGLLWVGTEQGPALFRQVGNRWELVGRKVELGWLVDTMAPAANGVWLGSDDHGLFLARADAHAPEGFTLERWGADRGLPAGAGDQVQVSERRDGVWASAGRGLFRLVGRRFVKDDDAGLRGLLAEGEVVQFREGSDGSDWAFSYHTIFHRRRGGHWQVELTGNPTLGAFMALLPLPAGDALIGAAGQVLRFHDDGRVRKGGDGARVGVTAIRLNRHGQAPQLLSLQGTPRFELNGASVDFDLGYTDFQTGEKIYQVMLAGLTSEWSAWSPQASYRFFALPPGTYTLRVRARIGYGAPVEGPGLRFEVVPRWFERWWVVPLAILLASAGVAAALVQRQRVRVRRLRAHNQELDRLVHERTLDLERVNLRLQDLADRDGLTGIANRRRFDAILDDALARARERSQALGLAMVDVDHFKQYNDGHGHQAGDDILRGVARVLADGVRGDTLVARYGGEEFAIVAPGCDLTTMREVAERLRAQVEASPLGVRVSLGVCAREPASDEGVEALLARADAALYRAKESGRNRVAW